VAKQDGWRWDFDRLPTWQEVLERGQAHCRREHNHGAQDLGSLTRPTHAIVYEDEPLAAAAADVLGLDIYPESDCDNLYASDEPDIKPATTRRASPRPRGTSLVSDPPSPAPAVISSEAEEEVASPPCSSSISTTSSLTSTASAARVKSSASAAQIKSPSSGRFPSFASTPASSQVLWINEYTGAVYANGCVQRIACCCSLTPLLITEPWLSTAW